MSPERKIRQEVVNPRLLGLKRKREEWEQKLKEGVIDRPPHDLVISIQSILSFLQAAEKVSSKQIVFQTNRELALAIFTHIKIELLLRKTGQVPKMQQGRYLDRIFVTAERHFLLGYDSKDLDFVAQFNAFCDTAFSYHRGRWNIRNAADILHIKRNPEKAAQDLRHISLPEVFQRYPHMVISTN